MNYVNFYDKIKKHTITINCNSIFLFIIGFLSCYFTNTRIGFGIRVCFIGFVALYILGRVFFSQKINIKGIGWYLVFFLYVFVSLFWSSNHSSFIVVLERMIPGILIGISIFLNKNIKKDYSCFFQGVVVGMVISALIVFNYTSNSFGTGRIGEEFYGSDVEFGTLCCYALYSSLILIILYKKNKLLNVIFCVFLYFGILASGTRKTTFQPFIVLLIYFIIKYRKSSKLFLFLLFSILIFVFSINIIFNNEVLYNLVGYRIDSMINYMLGNGTEDGSMVERRVMISLAIENFPNRPIFGHGIYSFAYDFSSVFGREVYSHNNFLEILYCYGIIGLVLFYWKYIFSIINIKNLFKSKENILLFGMFVSILICDFYAITFMQPLAILFVSLFMNCVCKKRDDEINE